MMYPRGQKTLRDSGEYAASEMIRGWVDRTARQGGPVTARELDQVPWQERAMWRQFGAFVHHYRPEWISGRLTATSDVYDYAVTAYWSARIGGHVVVGFAETTRQLFPALAIQLAAVIKADRALADVDDKLLPKFERSAVLHVRPGFTRLTPVDRLDENFRMFLAVKAGGLAEGYPIDLRGSDLLQ
jgi:hypothetical protein